MVALAKSSEESATRYSKIRCLDISSSAFGPSVFSGRYSAPVYASIKNMYLSSAAPDNCRRVPRTSTEFENSVPFTIVALAWQLPEMETQIIADKMHIIFSFIIGNSSNLLSVILSLHILNSFLFNCP